MYTQEVLFWQMAFVYFRKSSSWTVDDFEIGNLLGRGRFGYVYCGREKQTRFVVALKVLRSTSLFVIDYNCCLDPIQSSIEEFENGTTSET